MLLVPAGKAVDAAILSLLPFLEENDIVIDGGNSHFTDTNRRVAELNEKGIHFVGMGISGGEKGARFGPSMMPGGDKEAYERLRPIFEAISAKVNNEPCVTYMGTGSAGHYVKMVHNGIEYGIMQLISEVYDLLKRGLNYSDEDLQKTFEDWNQGELQSYLLEITGEVLNKFDDITGNRLVNLISDRAMAKGTGKWTSQNAMDLQSPIPVIDAAVTMRDLSTYKDERVRASESLKFNNPEKVSADLDTGWIDQIKEAYHFAMITIYAQGMAQLHKASMEYNYGLNPENIARIWRGGCIIRALCLEDFRQAFNRDAKLPNLMLDEQIGGLLVSKQHSLRATIKLAIDKGVPVAAFMASLAYFDAYRSATLPTNLIQSQRDYFGAHLYERIDQEGTFHTHWDQQ